MPLIAGPILALFDPGFPALVGSAMALFGFGLLGTRIKHHYILLARSQQRVMRAALWLTVLAGMELGCAAIGGSLGNVVWLTICWLIAHTLSSAFLEGAVLRLCRFLPTAGRQTWHVLSNAGHLDRSVADQLRTGRESRKLSMGEQMSLRRSAQVLTLSAGETPPSSRYVRHRMNWLQLYRTDIARYKLYRPSASLLDLLFTEQALWALLEHRIASGVHYARLPDVIKRPCLYALEVWQKVVEVLTGIAISREARIGPGFYIGHFGQIFIGKDAKIGAHCNIAQGVTIGESGGEAQRGAPRLGDRVRVGPNAVLVGRITIGDNVVIAPNTLVIKDVSESSVMIGVPAKCVSKAGSHGML